MPINFKNIQTTGNRPYDVTRVARRYDDGGELITPSWNGLTMREKSDVMAAAVRNGITSLKEIRQRWNEFAEEGHLYKDGGKTNQRNQRAGYAVDYFMNKGLSREAAAGLVGNLMRESGMNPNALNSDRHGGAHGIAQWRGARWANLQKMYGKNPTLDNQLDYVWHELNTTHKKGLQKIMASKTVDDAARNAFGYYEFSAGPEAAIAAMNGNGRSKGYNQPNGTMAMNTGINYAHAIYGNAPKGGVKSVYQKSRFALPSDRSQDIDFFGTLDNAQMSENPVLASIDSNSIPPNPTDYGTPVDYTKFLKPVAKEDSNVLLPEKRDSGIGLMGILGMMGADDAVNPYDEAFAQQEPVGQKDAMFVVPVSNDTLLDDSWFAKGGALYDGGGVVDMDAARQYLHNDLMSRPQTREFYKNDSEEDILAAMLVDKNLMTRMVADPRYQKYTNPASLPEVTVTPSATKDANGNYFNASIPQYDSAFHPEDTFTFMNTATLGLGNLLTVSQDAELLRNALNGDTPVELMESATTGNKGIFNNPYANLALDFSVPVGVAGIANAPKIAQGAKALGNAAWHSTYTQYPRYYLGKLYYGLDTELPTLYRKLGDIPQINNRRIQLSPVFNRFAYITGEESPLITNMTTDVPVRSHAANWDKFDVLAFPGKTLLGKHVISTRPSDTFTFGDLITARPQNVSYISGRPRALRIAEQRGMNTITSQEAKDISRRHTFSSSNDYSDYAKELQSLTRASFHSPTIKDYKFMDWVFQPQYKSKVYPFQDLSNPSIANLENMPGGFAELFGNSLYRSYLSNPEEWRNVLYHPASSVEDRFRTSKGIELKDDIPFFKKK